MNTTEESGTKKRRVGYGCWITAAMLMFAVWGLSILFGWLQAARRVEAELASLRAAGQPTTPEELAEFYKSPNQDEDTTQLWLDGLRSIADLDFLVMMEYLPIFRAADAKPLAALDQDWPDLPAIRQLLIEHQYALDNFHTAAVKGGRARYSVKFQDGFGGLLTHLNNMRDGAKLLGLEALVRARDGDAHGAAESIHAVFMMTRSLENEPLQVSQHFRMNLQSIAIVIIELLLPQMEFGDEDLRMFQTDLRMANWHTSLQSVLAGERSLGIITFHNPAAAQKSNNDWMAGRRALSNDDLLLYLQFFQQLIDAAREPWPQALQQQDQVDQQLQKLFGGSPLSEVRHIFTASLVPDATGAFAALAGADARRQAADTAIAIELFRRKHGQLPAKLDELVPEFLPQLPLDPFDGQPLRFIVRADEYVIYSIGADRIDNGGQKQDNANNEISFTVKRPTSPPRPAGE